MKKKTFSHIGLSVILTLFLTTPVFSDAPSDLFEQQSRRRRSDSLSESDRFEDGDFDDRGATNTRPDRLQGNNNSPNKENSFEDGGSRGGGSGNTNFDRINGGDSSSRENGFRDGATNDRGSINTIIDGDDSSSGESGFQDGDPTAASSSGGGGVGIINSAPVTNGSNSSPSEQKSNSGGIISTSEGKTPGVNNDSSANVLDAFARNSFIPWFLLLLLLGLLGALWWRFRRYRLVTEQDLEDRIDQEVSKRLEQHVNQYVDQIFEQKINNNIGLITGSLLNQPEINRYIVQCVDGGINHTFEQRLHNYTHLITHNLVNNNDGLNQYIDQRLQHTLINNSRFNNQIVTFVANSPEINNKINQFYRDVDLKVENLRREWNQTFINLLRQHVDELIGMIGGKETFNILMANAIALRVDELHHQITTTKSELTLLISDAETHLYDWTLEELRTIKGCLTDRQALVEHLAFFSAKLSQELNHNPCVDINTFKPFKLTPVSATQLSSVQVKSLSNS